ncbi:hypothetical protein J3R83DRAFT_2378 [Lanmaoa asiatica]|nr:hypothetical protein J3R83DRAFT_2378 [Lanmaoa asiatica]
MISTSLHKRLEGPTDIPEAPPSPSPRLDPTLPPPLPLEQTSLPLPPEEKARPTPVLLNAPLLEPPTVGDPTIPTPVPPPHRQEMPSIHPHAALESTVDLWRFLSDASSGKHEQLLSSQ